MNRPLYDCHVAEFEMSLTAMEPHPLVDSSMGHRLLLRGYSFMFTLENSSDRLGLEAGVHFPYLVVMKKDGGDLYIEKPPGLDMRLMVLQKSHELAFVTMAESQMLPGILQLTMVVGIKDRRSGELIQTPELSMHSFPDPDYRPRYLS